jgi:hypothetical protein
MSTMSCRPSRDVDERPRRSSAAHSRDVGVARDHGHVGRRIHTAIWGRTLHNNDGNSSTIRAVFVTVAFLGFGSWRGSASERNDRTGLGVDAIALVAIASTLALGQYRGRGRRARAVVEEARGHRLGPTSSARSTGPMRDCHGFGTTSFAVHSGSGRVARPDGRGRGREHLGASRDRARGRDRRSRHSAGARVVDVYSGLLAQAGLVVPELRVSRRGAAGRGCSGPVLRLELWRRLRAFGSSSTN